MKLTRTGYITGDTPEVKKELTVRPIVNADFGQAPPSFKVFRKSKSGLCVPRFYGEQKFGTPKEDNRPEPAKIKIKFNGKLRDETFQNIAWLRMRPLLKRVWYFLRRLILRRSSIACVTFVR
jgi:hypothetical protein